MAPPGLAPCHLSRAWQRRLPASGKTRLRAAIYQTLSRLGARAGRFPRAIPFALGSLKNPGCTGRRLQAPSSAKEHEGVGTVTWVISNTSELQGQHSLLPEQHVGWVAGGHSSPLMSRQDPGPLGQGGATAAAPEGRCPLLPGALCPRPPPHGPRRGLQPCWPGSPRKLFISP